MGTYGMAPNNLLGNPSAEELAANQTDPLGWTHDGWGTNTATHGYVDDGHTGNKAMKVTVSNYTDGDAKWYPTPVNVSGSTQYTFKDWYKSTALTSVFMQLRHADNSVDYAWIGDASASSGWSQASFTFTTPSDVIKATPFHVIAANGTLTIDDMELYVTSDPSSVGNLASVTDTVTRTQSGQITTDIVNSGSNELWYNYTYDTAGRLTGANIGPHTYTYGFGTQNASFCGTGAGTNPNSGKSSNRTSQTIDGVTTDYCYDNADRLIASTDAVSNAVAYDSHGNMTQIGNGTSPLYPVYDSSDRNIGFEQYTASGTGLGMYYDRDVQGRIVGRYADTITNWNWVSTGNYFYGFTGAGDSPDYVRDGSWSITEKYLQLPGGITATIYPQKQNHKDHVNYSLPNIHGDTLLTMNGNGGNVSTGNGPASSFTYDPFGNILAGSTLPNNADQASFGYVGQHQKFTESNFTLTPIQMGARVYFPTLGRFASVDLEQGGTDNNYVYVTDPVNDFDLSGEFGWKSIANVASWASVIPGPVGMAAAGVSVVAYAAAGDKKQAMIAAAGIAAAAVGAGAAVKAAQVAKAAGTSARLGEAVAKSATKVKGPYSVYHGVDSAGVVRYVGITKRNPVTRFAEHAKNPEKAGLNFRVVHSGLNKAGARGKEQMYINRWGLGKNGGKLINKINSIRRR